MGESGNTRSTKESVPLSVWLDYEDYDSFASAAQFWDLDFVQLDKGPFTGRFTQFGGPDIVLGYAGINRKTRQAGWAPREARTFAIAVRPEMEMWWRGHDVIGDDVLVYPAGSEIDCSAPNRFEILTLSIPESTLVETSRQLDLPDVDRLLDGREVARCGAGLSRLRMLLDALLRAAEPDVPNDARCAAYRNLREEAPALLLRALAEGRAPLRRRNSHVRTRALKAAEDYLADHPEEAVTVSDLCHYTGASERTLQYAFSDRYGVSPKAYLQAHRLERARRDLRQADPATMKVVDVANLWGFWHMGQFAADYRSQFGELPSETLKRPAADTD